MPEENSEPVVDVKEIQIEQPPEELSEVVFDTKKETADCVLPNFYIRTRRFDDLF